MSKESELKLIIDKNGIIGKQNKDDLLIYEAFLNFVIFCYFFARTPLQAG